MTYQTIIAGTDFSERAGRAVEAAAVEARRYGAHRVHLAHVVPVTGFHDVMPPTYSDALRTEAQAEALHAADLRLKKLAGALSIEAEVTCEATVGRPGRDLAAIAQSENADLLLVTSHGRRTLARTLLGSVASNLLRTAPCPVLVIRPEGPVLPEAHDIIAAVDLSPISESVVHHATRLAAPTGAAVRVITVCEPPLLVAEREDLFFGIGREDVNVMMTRTEEALENLIAPARAQGVRIEAEVVRHNPPAEAILDRAEMVRPGLVVAGTSGRNAWHRLVVGATASRLVAEAPCPVLAITPPPDPNKAT